MTISYPARFLVFALGLMAAFAAHAQQVPNERYVVPFAGNQLAPMGRVGVYRTDQAAQAWGGAGRIREGKVVVLPAAYPDYDANALKLRRAGVLNVEDLAGFSGEAFGAEWDYFHATLRRARELRPLISENERDPLSWEPSDQAVAEIGRNAIPQLEDFRRVEAQIAESGWRAIERLFLMRVRGSRPVDLPEKPETWAQLAQAMADGEYTPEIRAALLLGPQAFATLQQIESESTAALAEEGLSPAPEHVEWIEWLEHAYSLLASEILDTMEGYEVVEGEGNNETVIRKEGLQPGMPRQRIQAGRWPEADYRLVYDYGLSSMRTLELLRGTLKPYGFKASWLLQNVREQSARRLASELVNLALNDALDENHFDGGTSATANLDHLLILVLCNEQLPDQIARLYQEASVEGTVEGSGQDLARSAEAKTLAADVMREALRRYVDRDAARPVRELIEGIRNNPHELSRRMKVARDDLKAIEDAHLGHLEELRSFASGMRGKFTWLIEVIRDLDRRALQDELSRRHDMNGDGKLDRNEQAAFESDFLGLLDAGYPRQLLDPGFIVLKDRDGGQTRFTGANENDGRRYDFQNSVGVRGLSIEISPAEERDLLLRLEPGASYRLTFKFLAKELDRQQSYVRFVPLNDRGEELYQEIADTNIADVEEEKGKFVPFDFARDRTETEMQSGIFTGSTLDGNDQLEWREVSFRINEVPASVAGLTFEIKLNRVAGQGAVYYRDFRLQKLDDHFVEDFEPKRDRNGNIIPEPDLRQSGVPGLWRRVLDMERGFSPHSVLRYNSVVVPENDEEGNPIGRSLEVRPQGGNVRLLSRRVFPLRRNRSYQFSGRLRTENMGDKKAWFEVLLYDEQMRPVTIDGLPTTPGNNVVRTPARGSNPEYITWKKIPTNADEFRTETLRLDDLRRRDLAEGYNTQVDSQRERFGIVFAQIALVVKGDSSTPDPNYQARVYVDDIELRQEPRVRLSLVKFFPPQPGLDDYAKLETLGHPVAILDEEEQGRPYKLALEFEVEGLAPNRAGYTYDFTLTDSLGNEVEAASIRGQARLDRTVYSDSRGNLGSRELPRIYIDDLDLANRMGYFLARFTLRYLGDPYEESDPVVSREFRIGFLPPSLLPEGRNGEFGVVLDRSSMKYRRIYDALQQLGVSELALPLYAQTTGLDPDAYSDQHYVEELRLLSDSLPDVGIVGMLGPTPDALQLLYPEDGAAAVYADEQRDEWRMLLERVVTIWADDVERMTFGAMDDPSYRVFSSDAASALDNIYSAMDEAGLNWAPREIPLVLANGREQDTGLAILQRSFEERWPKVMAGFSQDVQDRLQGALTIDDAQKLRDARPSRIWLRDKEHFSFYVPANLSAEDMEVAVNEYLARVAKFENALGDDPDTALANAQEVLAGNSSAVDFDGMVGDLATPHRHTLVFELVTVDPKLDTSYIDQLRDMTEKVVAAKRMGFTRILVNRLRDKDERPSGLLSRANYAQPAFFAYRTLNSVLSYRDPVDRQLRLSSGAKHVFFKDEDSGDLTLVMFPTDEDVVEQIALGKNARRIDLMGNEYPLESVRGEIPLASGETEKAPTGEVRIQLFRGGLPVIISGIDSSLMDSLLALKLDNPSFQAVEAKQQRTLTVTNTFNQPTTFAVGVPFVIQQGNEDNIAGHARFVDNRGRELMLGAGKLSFDAVELAPGETRDFTFSIMPRSTMNTGERILPVQLTIIGRQNYQVLHRLAVTVDPIVSVTRASIAAPPEQRTYQVVLDVASNAAEVNTMVATISIEGVAEAFSNSFNVPAQGNAQAILNMPRYARSKLVGRRAHVSLRQSPGALFYNEEYVIGEDEATGALTLTPVSDEE